MENRQRDRNAIQISFFVGIWPFFWLHHPYDMVHSLSQARRAQQQAKDAVAEGGEARAAMDEALQAARDTEKKWVVCVVWCRMGYVVLSNIEQKFHSVMFNKIHDWNPTSHGHSLQTSCDGVGYGGAERAAVDHSDSKKKGRGGERWGTVVDGDRGVD